MELDVIFDKLGLTRTESNKSNSTPLLFITNRDGSLRWIWPASARSPLFLKFYHGAGVRASLFILFIRVAFTLRIQKLIFQSIPASINQTWPEHWALFTGTTGPNRKAILYTNEKGSTNFTKIAIGENAHECLNQEANQLQAVQQLAPVTLSIPSVLRYENGSLTVTDLSTNTTAVNEITSAHITALSEIDSLTGKKSSLKINTQWKRAKETLDSIEKTTDNRIPKGLLRKLKKAFLSVDESQYIDVSLSHGDFTPWNTCVSENNRLCVFDWELSDFETPYGFDAFHFIIQSGILIHRLTWTEIEQQVEKELFESCFFKEFSDDRRRLYLKLYLLIQITTYLKIYHEQKEWHVQVIWLLNTWNQALSSMLKTNESHRSLIIGDVFDFLQQSGYCVLKGDENLLSVSNEESDIDLCISKNDHKRLAKYLESHPLVHIRRVNAKSFMASEYLILRDGGLVSFDFIWQLRRKHLWMMDVVEIIERSYVGREGIRLASNSDNARFVSMFYALNNAPVPGKYRFLEDHLAESSPDEDQVLRRHFHDNVAAQILKNVNDYKENKGISGLINRINYIIDTVRETITQKGLVITFSGVDGAGKSTVIEKLKIQIEKRLRKRVVVLRHRPSLLPILSAWTKGKTTAEKDAATKLPRQGTNKNLLSSVTRFAYYYMDYLFGQWYINIKYVKRGYVVLYDRYYFDFINDSKRSNILLPYSIAKRGYRFLLKPDFNFFLYADPALILSRKQELDKSTIESLTSKYLNLFCQLNNSREDSRYVAIENTDLSQTLNTIFQRIQFALNAAS